MEIIAVVIIATVKSVEHSRRSRFICGMCVVDMVGFVEDKGSDSVEFIHCISACRGGKWWWWRAQVF